MAKGDIKLSRKHGLNNILKKRVMLVDESLAGALGIKIRRVKQ